MGIGCGYLLTLIAPEELDLARKYAVKLKHLLFASLIIATAYYLREDTVWQILFTGGALGIFVALLKRNQPLLEVLTYSVFIIPPFLDKNPLFQLTTTSLLFLYGFPLGILLLAKQKNKGDEHARQT